MLLAIVTIIEPACLERAHAAEGPRDLTGWTLVDPYNSWTYSNPEAFTGLLEQHANTGPAWALSDFILEATSHFTFTTSLAPHRGDDDLIGFAFNWQDNNNFYLLDWKGATQSHNWRDQVVVNDDLSEAGLKLQTIQGGFTRDGLWGGRDGLGVTTLAGPIGSGWLTSPDATHVFDVSLSPGNIVITMDNQPLFNVADATFTGGRIAAYDFSQDGFLFTVPSITNPDDTPLLTGFDIFPLQPSPTDFIIGNIHGFFPSEGFDIQLPPVVNVSSNNISIEVTATSPIESHPVALTPFNANADIGTVPDGSYNYLVELLVDNVIESTLQGSFDVITLEPVLVDVRVSPDNPVPDDFVRIDINGTFPSDGFEIQKPPNVNVTGPNEITVDVLATSPTGSPPQALTPFDVDMGFGTLPLGDYDHIVILYVDNVLEDTSTGSFTVGFIPDPTSLTLLGLGSVALLRRRTSTCVQREPGDATRDEQQRQTELTRRF